MNCNYKHIFFAVVVLVCLGGFFSKANCQTLGNEFQVNTYTPGGSYPSVAFDDSGRAIISWTSYDSDELGVFAQRFDASLLPLGSEFQVNTTTSRNQWRSEVEATANGEFVIVWCSNQGLPPDYWDMEYAFFQRYDSSAVAIGDETLLCDLTGPEYIYTPFMALSDAGAFEVFYGTFMGIPTWMYMVVGQEVGADGIPVGTEWSMIVAELQGLSVAGNGFGDYILAWSSIYSMELKAFTGSVGGPKNPEFEITSEEYVGYLDAAIDSTGNFVVVWTESGDGRSSLYAQRYDSSENPVGWQITIKDTIGTGIVEPRVAMLDNGYILAVWRMDWNIYGRLFQSCNDWLSDEFRINEAEGSSKQPDVSASTDGSFLITWSRGDAYARECFPALCDVQPSHLDFGSVLPGDSTDLDFTIHNVGCELLAGFISELCQYYEIVSGGGSYNIAKGDSHTVTVRFKSTQTGTWPCTIETGTYCSYVTCEGITPPPCFITPTHLDFGSISLGDSADLDFTIHNLSYVPLTGSVYESCPHFEIVSGGGNYEIVGGDSLVVVVRFKPTIEGPCLCTISTGTGCTNVTCEGTCTAPPPACFIDPDTLDFGPVDIGNFKMMTFDITNTGYGTLNGTMVEECTWFDIVEGGQFWLNHDQSQTVTIIFYPQSEGPYSCTIETGNDACSDVYCMGYGGLAPECLVQPDTLDFGIVIVGDSLDMSFDIINAGGGVLLGSVGDTCSCYNVVAGDGPYALLAGETLQVTVRFRPSADGPFECRMETGTSDCKDVCCLGMGDDVSGLGIVDANRFFLYQNYPNPFNPTTNITFTVPDPAHTNLSIYNIEGRLVKALVDGEFAGGVKTVAWNGTDSQGNPVSSGVYFYRLRAGNNTMTKKMVFLK